MAVPVYCPTKAQVVLVLKDPPASAGDMGLEFQHRSYLNGLVVFPAFLNLSLNLAIRSS